MQDQSIKKCVTCGETRPLSEFNRNRTTQDGYTRRCRPCIRGVPSGFKRCGKCCEIKELSRFTAATHKAVAKGGYRDGVLYVCKDCETRIQNERLDRLKIAPRKVVLEKTCTKCGFTKPSYEFGTDKRSPDWMDAECRECDRGYSAKFSHHNRRWHLRKKYGLTEEQAADILRSQDGRCAICSIEISFTASRDKPNHANIDHDHASGKVRGILCRDCNFRLGTVEKKDFLEKALTYLKTHDELHPIFRRILPNMV